jgi:DNA gyrase subunit A
MAQPFSLRYPLVDGQGNFGNIDDYPPLRCGTRSAGSRVSPRRCSGTSTWTRSTSPRTTTSRGASLGPPSRFPNLLVNGSAGIAVGMATNMPPHKLGEVVDAVVQLIDKPEANADDLMKHVKGPDFPTGAIVVGRSGVRDAYRTAVAGSSCAPARTSRSCAAGRTRSSSPSCRTA